MLLLPENPTALLFPRLQGMSTAGEVPAFFKSMGSDSPARSRQKFCGMFCPVEGSSDSKTLDFDALSACRGRSDGRVIDRQTDISQPRKVEIRESTGKEALQNLDDKRVIVLYFACFSPPHLSLSLSICFSLFLSSCNFCHPTFTFFAQTMRHISHQSVPIVAPDAHSSLFKLITRVCRSTCSDYISHEALCCNRVDRGPHHGALPILREWPLLVSVYSIPSAAQCSCLTDDTTL